MFYRPDEKSVCADVIPFYADGEFKLFYLRDYRGSAGRGEGREIVSDGSGLHSVTLRYTMIGEDERTVITCKGIRTKAVYTFPAETERE